jgi:membrane protease YdiL (CAAX protease family)
VALTLQEYLGHHLVPVGALPEQLGLAPPPVCDAPADRQLARLYELSWWAVGCVVFFFVLPALVVRLVFRQPLREYGVTLGEGFRHWWIYLVMIAVMVPLIWLVSMQGSFQRAYPFYTPARDEPLWPRFWCWELMYALQFFAIEFFFRGFMVHGLKHRFGVYGIFAMMVPYCMIHFLKPMPETFAAIIAGIVLGYMSLTTGSIWLGVVVHVCVALTMDFTALYRFGYFS